MQTCEDPKRWQFFHTATCRKSIRRKSFSILRVGLSQYQHFTNDVIPGQVSQYQVVSRYQRGGKKSVLAFCSPRPPDACYRFLNILRMCYAKTCHWNSQFTRNTTHWISLHIVQCMIGNCLEWLMCQYLLTSLRTEPVSGIKFDNIRWSLNK